MIVLARLSNGKVICKGLHPAMHEANDGVTPSFESEMEELYGTKDRSPEC